MTKRARILIIAIPLAIVLVMVIASIIGNRISAIPANPDDLVGSSAGNLYNGGTFCEADGLVYFSNPYDGGSIYVMNPDQTDMHRLITANASYINVGGGYIYYYSSSSAGQSGLGYMRDGRGLYRADIKGQKNIMLKHTTTDALVLIGNSLFYNAMGDAATEAGTPTITLNSMSIDGKDDAILLDEYLKPACGDNGLLYYAGMEDDHHLYSIDAGGTIVQVSEMNMYEPTLRGGMVFFLDMDDNMHLKSWSIYDNIVNVISEDRIESFNLSPYDDSIYYQTIDESGQNNYYLKKIRIDGSGEEIIYEGVAANVQITSSYVYFRSFNTDMPIYQVPLVGGSVTTFDAAMEAVVLP